jgi:hypothetical protein
MINSHVEQAGRYEIMSHAELNFLQVKRREDNIMATATATMKKRSKFTPFIIVSG